jgi:sigma-B regulation protein RsbU (phosphoserine phosphatase)
VSVAAPLQLRLEPRDGTPFRQQVQSPCLLGRSSKADVVLADRFLSRLHARLFVRGDGWFIEDLGSRNTTFLNDRPVSEPLQVRPGDVIRLAESRIYVEGELGEPATAEGSGDGLVGSDSDRLPGSTILRPAAQLLGEPAAASAAEPAVVDRLRIVNEVHRALAGPISLLALLDLILDRAFAHLSPEQAAVYIRRDDGGFDRPASRRAPGVSEEFLFSRRLAHEVTEKGLAALVTDASLDARFAAAESIVVSGVRSILAAPLLDSEGCLGMIVLTSRRRARPFGEDDMELLVALASAAALRIRNLELSEETARRRLLDRELELAHDIQMAMLPRSFPARREVELAAVLRPARSVGGDLYDVLDDGNSLWLLIGDVSGKGVGAAMFMAVTKTLFHALAPGCASAAEAVTRLNRELARDNERAMFVTVFAARLELASGELEFVNAGHNPTYRLAADNGALPLAGPVFPALGAVEDQPYGSTAVRLARGDALLLYTDGVVEAQDARQRQFESRRLEAYLAGCHGRGAQAIVDELVRSVEEFAAGTPQYDDLTVLALRYLGPA